MLNQYFAQGIKMANKRLEIPIGKRFGRLIIIKEEGRGPQGHIRYLCLCDCGNYKIVNGSSIIRENKGIKSCGCLLKEHVTKMGKNNKGKNRLEKGQAGKNHLYRRYIHNAKKRNLEFNISKEYLLTITQQNCIYCGQSPKQVINSEQENAAYIYNGIDRIDNLKGYVYGNCAPCCIQCNRAKSDLSREEFYNWILKVFETRYQ